jgi:hypothetical protein
MLLDAQVLSVPVKSRHYRQTIDCK